VVDHVLRLKLALLGSAFRPGRTLASTLGVLAIAGAVGSGLVIAALHADLSNPSHRAAAVLVPVIVSIGLVVAPLAAGLGSALEPRRFAPFPLEPRPLALALALAGIVGLPGALAVTLAISVELVWEDDPARTAAVVAGVLSVGTIILCSQVLVALAAHLAVTTTARRAITSVARATIAVALAAAAATLALAREVDSTTRDVLVSIAEGVGASPLGLLWAAPTVAAGEAVARLLGGALLVALLVALWLFVVARLLEAPQRPLPPSRDRGLGWFDLVPATPAGAIAARSLLYWTRDSRYRAVIVALPLAPVAMMIALAVAGSPLPPLWLLPLPVFALFLGWFAHNDAAYDHTALWMHVAAPLPGAADRWGRVVPPLVLGVPLILALSPLFVLWSGVDGSLPALIGISVGLLLTGLGVSSISSALAAYPAARPEAGLFDQPPTLGARAGWSQAISLLAVLALMAPSLLLAYWGLSSPEWYPVAGIAGAATGVGMLLLGIVVGGRLFRRRAPELLDLVLRT